MLIGKKQLSYYKQHIFVCTNQKKDGKKCCANQGGVSNFDYLKHQLIQKGLHGPGKVRVSRSGCLGRCKLGPCMVIYPEGDWYRYQSESDIDTIVEQHLEHQQRVLPLLIEEI